MVTLKSIKEQFDELGIEPSEEVANKCIEICLRHDIEDPIEFVEQWMAYSVSKHNGAEPTVELLRDMESHEYSNRVRKAVAPSAVSRLRHGEGILTSPRATTDSGQNRDIVGPARSPIAGGLVIYNNAELDSVESDVLGSYGCITPKAKKVVSRLHAQTPDCNKAQFSPASYSPLSSSKRLEQDGPSRSGNVVYTFGSALLLKQTSWSTESEEIRRLVAIEVRLYKGNQLTGQDNPTNEGPCFMSDECKYMYDSAYDRVLILGDRIYEGGKQICQRLAERRKQEAEQSEAVEAGAILRDDREASTIEEVAIHHVDFPSTDVISVLGRIVIQPDKKDDYLAIVDFDEMTLRYTKLDFSKMKSWTVFPGQTVILEGVNPRGTSFEVRKIHFERKLVLPIAPVQLGTKLNIVIASAPFTEKEDLLYEKLSDLLAYCSNNNPDVLILTGPFGSTSSPLFGTIAEPFEVYFEKIMTNIMSSVSASTEVLIVANHDDIMSMFVYPSFPYRINKFFKNLHFLPDPCVVSINGFEIGVTTVDVIKDLVDAEVGENRAGDRIKRAFNYMFHHQTFYPLNPPPENIPLDLDLLSEFGNLPKVPNMMICPGDLKCFVRDVNGCVCINPGHLSDPSSGEGTFARVVVHPPDAETAAPFSYIACQVVKS
ncbi:DNA polymerase alpha subunit B [Wyeomyia smithii]|uniref:DNA polymerase alpha subunit B n=1 Tax=Wyeomyia smithii TaxID=174621 RepID=UPI002467C151|nr:DNA polymerase alpha subunit B [Wyeomyia smithii]XP_055523125.1 DNA polymerase alpha subunit B [Wyeomyia smithii]XP_055523126.1 DNA polymerase alpha subunit B [Wyeomyia smithii]